jgi:hypothetical protein
MGVVLAWLLHGLLLLQQQECYLLPAVGLASAVKFVTQR